MSTERFATFPNQSLETQLLINRLKDGKPGDKVTDEEIVALIKMPLGLGTKGSGRVNSAVNYVLSHFNINWKRIRGAKLLECLDSSGTLNEMRSRNDRQRHAAKKTVQKAKTISYDKLSPEERNQAYAISVQAAMTEKLLTNDSLNYLAHREVREPLKIGQVLSLFEKK